FKLDTFLNTEGGAGLSSSFAAGSGYADWFSPGDFSVMADSYAISGVTFSADGSLISIDVAPVPEPASLWLILAGLGVWSCAASRRARRARGRIVMSLSSQPSPIGESAPPPALHRNPDTARAARR